MRRMLMAATLSLIGLAASATEPVYVKEGLALSGYDAVAYFTDGKPVAGDAQYETTWQGARWRFASAAHRDAFAAAPVKYAPQFGGYCAYGASKGYAVDADPLAWKIVDDKLYVNHNKKVQEMWERDLPNGVIDKAEELWPSVLAKK